MSFFHYMSVLFLPDSPPTCFTFLPGYFKAVQINSLWFRVNANDTDLANVLNI